MFELENNMKGNTIYKLFLCIHQTRIFFNPLKFEIFE